MQHKRSVIRFLTVTALLSIPLGIAVLRTDPLELHRAMHPMHSPTLDLFFRNVTHLADGLVPTVIGLLVLLFRDVRAFLMVGLSCSLSAIIAQVLKHGPYSSSDRPFMFKEKLGDMHWVDGLDIHHHFSFPSGHSTAAFSLCFALTVLIARPAWGIALPLLAALLAYSRVYLSQHFSEDILAGAIIGTATAVCVYQVLYRSRFAERKWLDRRVIRYRNQ